MTSSNFIATHLTLTINFISILITLVIMLEFSCLHLGSLYPRILLSNSVKTSVIKSADYFGISKNPVIAMHFWKLKILMMVKEGSISLWWKLLAPWLISSQEDRDYFQNCNLSCISKVLSVKAGFTRRRTFISGALKGHWI